MSLFGFANVSELMILNFSACVRSSSHINPCCSLHTCNQLAQQWIERSHPEQEEIQDEYLRSVEGIDRSYQQGMSCLREQARLAEQTRLAEQARLDEQARLERARLEEQARLDEQAKLIACTVCRGVKKGVCPVSTLGLECAGDYTVEEYNNAFGRRRLIDHPDRKATGSHEAFIALQAAQEQIHLHLQRGDHRKDMWEYIVPPPPQTDQE